MAGYLGYDPCSLGVLLGALEAVRVERIGPAGPRPAGTAARQAEDALAVHRRCVASLVAFAEPIGAVLRGDPLGRFRLLALDAEDLDLWALHRGGRWSTVTDHTAGGQHWRADLEVRNARLLAVTLTPRRLGELLHGDGREAAPLVRYLAQLEGRPAARAAFLDALGPSGFGALIDHAARTFIEHHLAGRSEHPVAARSDEVVVGLAGVWAGSRAAGLHRGAAWDAAALGGELYGAARVLRVAGQTPGALTTGELARWGTDSWQRLSNGLAQPGLPWPEVVGDEILAALIADGRSARAFLLELGRGPDRRPLTTLLLNGASTPTASGALLIASTNPAAMVSAADLDEARRSMQVVLAVLDRLLVERVAFFPSGPAPLHGRVLPDHLGLYVGRQLHHLVDPCDGTGADPCPIASAAWDGWGQRQIAGLLPRLVADQRVAVQLQAAAWAGALHRLSRTDLVAAGAAGTVETEAHLIGAVSGLLGDRAVDAAFADQATFDAQVAGVDLVIDTVGRVVPVAGPVTAAWGVVSGVSGALGLASPTELLMAPLRPEPVQNTLAREEATAGLAEARLKRSVAAIALAQLEAAGRPGGPPPPADLAAQPDDEALAAAEGTDPDDNANTAAYQHLAELEDWRVQAQGSPAGDRIDHLQAVTGDAFAQGRRWLV